LYFFIKDYSAKALLIFLMQRLLAWLPSFADDCVWFFGIPMLEMCLRDDPHGRREMNIRMYDV